MRPLSALHLKAVAIVLDLARANPFARSGNPLTGGLALVEPEPGTLVAFNAGPGTIAPDESGPYSAYAQGLAEISREGGVSLDDAFARVRLRVNQITNGGQVPWHASKLQAPIYLFERAPDAPPPLVTPEQTASLRQRPIRDFEAHEAYLAALDRDTLEGYEDFLAAYPNDPMARRGPARGDYLAAHQNHRHAAGLLVISETLPARRAFLRLPKAFGLPIGCVRAAAHLHGHRLRPASASAR